MKLFFRLIEIIFSAGLDKYNLANNSHLSNSVVSLTLIDLKVQACIVALGRLG